MKSRKELERCNGGKNEYRYDFWYIWCCSRFN